MSGFYSLAQVPFETSVKEASITADEALPSTYPFQYDSAHHDNVAAQDDSEQFSAPSPHSDTVELDMVDHMQEAVKEGNHDGLAWLLDQGSDLNSLGSNGKYLLHFAVEHNSLQSVKTILERMTDVNANVNQVDKRNATALHLAAAAGNADIVRELLRAGADPLLQDNQLRLPAHHAAQHGHVDVLHILLGSGEHLSERNMMAAHDKWHHTPLHVTVREGHYEATELLLTLGASPFHADKDGLTALHIAAEMGHADLAALMLTYECDSVDPDLIREGLPRMADHQGMTPLHLAANYGHVSAVEALAQHDPSFDVDQMNPRPSGTGAGWTPLHYAAIQGHAETLRFLLKLGADALREDKQGMTPMHLAAQHGCEEAVKVLMQAVQHQPPQMQHMESEDGVVDMHVHSYILAPKQQMATYETEVSITYQHPHDSTEWQPETPVHTTASLYYSEFHNNEELEYLPQSPYPQQTHYHPGNNPSEYTTPHRHSRQSISPSSSTPSLPSQGTHSTYYFSRHRSSPNMPSALTAFEQSPYGAAFESGRSLASDASQTSLSSPSMTLADVTSLYGSSPVNLAILRKNNSIVQMLLAMSSSLTITNSTVSLPSPHLATQASNQASKPNQVPDASPAMNPLSPQAKQPASTFLETPTHHAPGPTQADIHVPQGTVLFPVTSSQAAGGMSAICTPDVNSITSIAAAVSTPSQASQHPIDAAHSSASQVETQRSPLISVPVSDFQQTTDMPLTAAFETLQTTPATSATPFAHVVQRQDAVRKTLAPDSSQATDTAILTQITDVLNSTAQAQSTDASATTQAQSTDASVTAQAPRPANANWKSPFANITLSGIRQLQSAVPSVHHPTPADGPHGSNQPAAGQPDLLGLTSEPPPLVTGVPDISGSKLQWEVPRHVRPILQVRDGILQTTASNNDIEAWAWLVDAAYQGPGWAYLELEVLDPGETGLFWVGLGPMVPHDASPGILELSYTLSCSDGTRCQRGTHSPYGRKLSQGDVLGVFWNKACHSVSLTVNRKHWGIAFTDVGRPSSERHLGLYYVVGSKSAGLKLRLLASPAELKKNVDSMLCREQMLHESSTRLPWLFKGHMHALHYAACCNNTDALVALLNHGVAVDLRDDDGWTALHFAATHGHLNAARMLLEAQADVNATTKYQSKPLILAVRNSHTQVALALMHAGADLSVVDHNNRTLLMRAARAGNKEIIRVLLDKGVDLHAADRYGKTALQFAKNDEVYQLIEEAIRHQSLVPQQGSAANAELDAGDDKPWDILPQQLELMPRPLAAGAYGVVWKGTYMGSTVAVKTLQNGQVHNQAAFLREAQLMARLRHPNIVTFYGAVTRPNPYGTCIVTEFCDRGSLFDLLHPQREMCSLKPNLRLKIAQGIANGMAYLHAQCPPIVHRDLKSSNVLLTSKFIVKVSDFGLSTIKRSRYMTTAAIGTFAYMAPEVMAASIESATLHSRQASLMDPAALPLALPAMPSYTHGHDVSSAKAADGQTGQSVSAAQAADNQQGQDVSATHGVVTRPGQPLSPGKAAATQPGQGVSAAEAAGHQQGQPVSPTTAAQPKPGQPVSPVARARAQVRSATSTIQYNEKVDVYSFGVVLYELVTEAVPFGEFQDVQIYHLRLTQRLRLQDLLPHDVDPDVRDLIHKCMHDNPSARPTFPEIQQMLAAWGNKGIEPSAISQAKVWQAKLLADVQDTPHDAC